MDNIKISEIENSKNKFLHIDVEETIDEIKADINASLDITPLGDFISVKGQISGKTKLICDLCLTEYDYEFDFEIDEMYAKNPIYDGEKQEVETLLAKLEHWSQVLKEKE